MEGPSQFVTTLLRAFPELASVADQDGALAGGRVWELAGGMHVPDPHQTQFTRVQRWHGFGSFEDEPYELQLDRGQMTKRGLHAILFLRYTRLHCGPRNQATVMLRSDNQRPNGDYFIRFAGKTERRSAIRHRIQSEMASGLPVDLAGHEIRLAPLASAAFRERLLRVGCIIAHIDANLHRARR